MVNHLLLILYIHGFVPYFGRLELVVYLLVSRTRE